MTRVWTNKSVLITGVTGTLGTALCKRLLLGDDAPIRLVGISRKWQDQDRLRNELNNNPRLRLFIGDIRDIERLRLAMRGIDIVIAAAAMKSIVDCQYNPTEAISINILGTQNTLQAALENDVERVVVISSDKASQSGINMYGVTKAACENLTVAYNSYSSRWKTKYSALRYGNVSLSSGSVIPLFIEQKKSGFLTVTDTRMSRFVITIDQAVEFVLNCIENMIGGEIFVPHLPSAKVVDIAYAIAPEAEMKVTGIRPGEKLHEVMIAPDEAYRTRDLGWAYQVEPQFPFWAGAKFPVSGSPIQEGWTYSSASAPRLSIDDIKVILDE